MVRSRRVALLLGADLGYCRQVLRGVQQYVPSEEPWIFHDAAPEMALLPALRQWRPDGVIALLFGRPLAAALERLRRPVVNVTHTLADLPFPVVDVDHQQVGRLAAAHLLERGFKNFGYFGSAVASFSIGRFTGFDDALAAAGFSCSRCPGEFWPRLAADTSWSATNRRVLRWLNSLPKPVGVLASNDIPARELAAVCREAGLRVPEDVAILGVDNDDLECSLSSPPLSSVALPAERIGFEAAATLDRLFAGETIEPRERFLPPLGVVTRQSTDILAIDDPELVAAVRYIHNHAARGMRVEDVVRAVPLARRTLEKRFRRHLGRSPFDEIQRVRLERVKQLLSLDQMSVAQIAAQTGFENSQSLAILFRRETGQTCSEFRRQFRVSPTSRDGPKSI
jgi:LacI family transcriptional regulator